MTIKLLNFTATIDVESIEVTHVNDDVKNKIASVDLLINGKFTTSLHGFTYSDSWEDEEVLAWANKELINYQIE